MNVMMFCPQFAPLVGGAERQAERLAKALRARGIDVDVWTPLIDPDSPLEETRDGLRVHRFTLDDLSRRWPRLPGVGLLNTPWLGLQVAARLWQPIGRADVAHCHIGCLLTIAVGVAAWWRGTPVICKAAIADHHSDLGEMRGLVGRMVARLGRNVFTSWVATTRAVADALVRAGVAPTRIVVIPNGVELVEDAQPRTRRPIRRFLYLGRLSSNIQRDTPTLIRAFDAAAESLPDLELALVGDGDLLEQTRALAGQSKHADRIRVPGLANADEWLRWADCFVLPSRREGLSNALLEAMAFGLPCIANDIPPNREVLADGVAGLLVGVGDVDALQMAIGSLTRGDIDSRLLGAHAAARAKQTYSMSSVVERYLAMYQALGTAPT